MRTIRTFGLSVAALFVAYFSVAAAKDEKKDGADDLAVMKPGPEHEILKLSEGSWDAVSEIKETPDAQATVSKGTETNTLGCGELWLIEDYKGDFGGLPFHGHGVSGYDPQLKKHVASWVDSMTMSILRFEGTYDKEKKALTMHTQSMGMSGQIEKWRAVTEFKDKDTRVWTAYFPADGKEFAAMKITYKRKK